MSGASNPSGQDEQHPFQLPWVNSCYHQTLLPDAPWHKLEGRVAQLLATRVERQFSHPQRKEMLLELLGRHFVDTYLSHVKRDPQVLDANHMGGEEYDRLKIEATSWLNNQMYKAVKDAGLQAMLTGAAASDTDALPPDYAAFLQHTFTVFSSGLERELFKQERDLREKKEKELLNPKKAPNADIFKVPAPSRLKPLSTLGTTSSASSVPKPTSAQLRGMIHTVQGDPPPMWGHQSDCIGAAVVSLLQRDPRKFDQVAGRLHGRQLPGTLRQYMWADVLLKQERKRMKEVSAEKVVRERFARAVTRGLTELKIKKPTQSPINGLIQNAVIETYSKTVSMLPYKHIEHVKEAARALNVLYVYDRSYEPYLINWLFPLQIAFRDKDQHSQDHGEHVLELGMYLDLLNTSCYPSWPEVFAIAECVMQRLQDEDPELHDHLKHIATINVQGHPKEFLVQLIHQEKEKAELLLKSVPNTARSMDQSARQLLADPLIFLRRWIGEGFVSVVDTPAVMYIWDQCFLQSWSHSVLQNVCLALLQLLRYRFMEARNYVEMKEVFLNEACKLYTVDIQMAWIHVENGKHLLDIYNRQQPNLPASRMSGAPSQATTPAPGLLQTFGIKRLKAKLIVPAETIQREPWLMSIDPSGLRLCCTIYFGSIQLNRRISTNTPIVISAAKDTYGNMVYELEFPGERYVYPNFDLSQYDVERELGASPYAILSMEYMMPTTSQSSGLNLIPLGWSRVLLFRGGAEGAISVEQFTLIEGETWVALHPGDIPDSLISTQPATPSETQEDAYLGYNSELGALVFDPNREPRTPQPQVPPLELQQVPPADTRRQPPPPSQRTPRQPKPPPISQPPTKRSPPPPSVPTPAPSVPARRSAPREPETDPWVAYDPKAATQNPTPTSCREPFDIYMDSVRYIPDNASIIKVTGRLLKAGDLSNLQDILALPLLGKSARCPEFDFRMTVNADRQRANPEMILLLRVYTVDIVTEQVVVIGSCLLKMFDTKKKDGALRVGGHQLRLHSGMPDVKQGINNLKHTDLDPAPAIPGCSVLVRILPHSQEAVAAPSSGYASGYYQSVECQPTKSEKRIFKSYADHMVYPQTERDMIFRLQDSEGKRTEANKDSVFFLDNIVLDLPGGGRNDDALLEWLQDRLDIKKQLSANKPADNLSLIRCVRYRLKMGLWMKANKAFNLPDNLYIVCVAQVSPGGQAASMSPADDGLGKNEPVVMTRLKRDGPLQAPQWEGEPQAMHPYYDDNSVLVVRLVGIPLAYRPTADNKTAGTLALADGGELKIVKEHVIGWTVVPLFDGNSVQIGTHHVPVFKGDIPDEILREMRTTAPQDVISRRTWSKTNMHMAASLALTLWDGHFDYNELPVVPTYTVLEEAAGDAQACQAVRNKSGTFTGSKVSDIVLNGLPPKVKKQGVKGSIYQKEHGFFDEVVASDLSAAVTRALSEGVMVGV
ncbi:hypothetical protein BaRGS_00033703 [Batillaria attramentaria]|uniref:Uncharacterized protein n=1 Tax=Batillaria attramentaria TaxID=370345 RepID=A0ABD0JKL2_9CAEN